MSLNISFSTGPPWRPLSIAYLKFTFITIMIHWHLFTDTYSASWYRFCSVCSWHIYEIYSEGGPSTYVYCVVCYRVITALYVRNVVVSCTQLHSWRWFRTPNGLWALLTPYSLFLYCCPFTCILKFPYLTLMNCTFSIFISSYMLCSISWFPFSTIM